MQADISDTAAAPKAHPYAFDHIHEARDALKRHVGKLGDRELKDIRHLASALRGWSYMMIIEEMTPLEEDKVRGGYMFIEQLGEASERLEAWYHRLHKLTVIVEQNDVNALAKYPHLLKDAEAEAEA